MTELMRGNYARGWGGDGDRYHGDGVRTGTHRMGMGWDGNKKLSPCSSLVEGRQTLYKHIFGFDELAYTNKSLQA